MGITKITENNSLDDIEYPDVVYKYRCWENPFHQSIITNRQVFMAAPSDFDDKLDCKFPVRWDLLTDADIYKYFLSDSKKKNPERTRQQHREFARDWMKKSAVRNPQRVKEHQARTFNDYNERVGVLSLTANPSIERMWVEYGCNHEGFAVGFNSRIMFEYLGGGGEVIYVDNVPVIYPMPKHSFYEQRHYQIFHKLSEWSYEEEYRTTIFRPNPLATDERIIQLPPEAYQEIILGSKMSANNIAEVKDILERELEHMEIKVAKKVGDNILIEKYN